MEENSLNLYQCSSGLKSSCFGKNAAVKLLKILQKCHVRESLWLSVNMKKFMGYIATLFTQSSLNTKTMLKAYINLITIQFLLTLHISCNFFQYLVHEGIISSHISFNEKSSFPQWRKSTTFGYSEMKQVQNAIMSHITLDVWDYSKLVLLRESYDWILCSKWCGERSKKVLLKVLLKSMAIFIGKLGVLVLAGIQLIFSMVGSREPCFGFMLKPVLIIQGCLSYCWVVLAQSQGLFCFSHHTISEQVQEAGREYSQDG